MTESIWYNKIEIEIEQKSENLHAKDLKFYQVDRFLKLAKRIDKLSVECKECKFLKQQIEETAGSLDVLLSGEIALRKKYENKLTELDKHLRKAHQIYPNQYFLYLYSFVGIAGGLLLGAVIGLILDAGYTKTSVILGFAIGLAVGRIYGKLQDSKLKKEDRII